MIGEGYSPENTRLGTSEFAEEFDAMDEAENERYAFTMLRDLGLTFEDLRERGHILDVGSGPSSLGRAVASRGIEVTSLDHTLEHLSTRPEVAGRQVLADAEQMPFRDETFGLVISHLGSPPRGDTEKEIRTSLDEIERILTTEGELRMSAISRGIGRAKIGNPELLRKNLYDPSLSEADRRTWEELEQNARDETIAALQEMGYDIREEHFPLTFQHVDGRTLQREHSYWVMRKRPKE